MSIETGDPLKAKPPETGDEKPDAVEIWARRTGRTLGYIALAAIAVYLVITYGPQ
jgi:hypothetical protein